MQKIRGKKKLFLYGMAGLGVNMLNLIIGSYLCDALMIEGFQENIEHWTYLNKTLVVAAIWSLMIAIAKIVDGIIDIPLAGWTDKLKSRWGKRRPAILLGMIPMMIAYALFLFPLQNAENSILNTVWFGVMLCVFYTFYTLTMVTYYATFSEIVDNESDRVALSNFKTVFDVIYFVLGYALIPAFIGSANIRIIALAFLPLSLTMLIPLFMIKEKSTLDKDVEEYKKNGEYEEGEQEEHVGIIQSFKYAIKNKSFMVWMMVYFALEFSVQLFLTGQNVLYSGYMGFEGVKITVIMACAFAPIPFTLILYNKIVRKHGLKMGYIFSLIAYLLARLVTMLCSQKLIPNETVRLVVAALGGILSAFGTGCFFSINYTIPSNIADNERRETGISHPAMYFAIQGLFGGVASALSTGIVWVNLKNIGGGQFIWIMPLVVILGGLVSMVMTKLMSKDVSEIGKVGKKKE